jgi:N-acetylmuramoyl-L-alanine amidase
MASRSALSGGGELSRRRLLQLAGTAGLALAATKPAAAGAAPSRVMLCRNAWGAAPARPGGTPHTPDRMTIHHTEVLLGDNADAPARLRQHQRYHQDSQGWIDIAYHLSVDRNGNIYQLRDPKLVGDTATGYDPTGHFLVVCEGDFDKEGVTKEQLDGAALAFAWAAQQFGIPTDTLAGHRDLSGETTCPGAGLYSHVTSGDLAARIDDILAAGPVDLETVCGPEADALVADIEAGRR